MARPIKWRKIEYEPIVPYYVPAEKEVAGIEMNVLLMEEVEAIRLRDLLGLDQAECAQRMEVSRPTFQRILLSAREKIADGIVNGHGIHINGGNFTRNVCAVHCEDCQAQWKESFENVELMKNGLYACPSCGSTHISCIKTCNGHLCNKVCWKNKCRHT